MTLVRRRVNALSFWTVVVLVAVALVLATALFRARFLRKPPEHRRTTAPQR